MYVVELEEGRDFELLIHKTYQNWPKKFIIEAQKNPVYRKYCSKTKLIQDIKFKCLCSYSTDIIVIVLAQTCLLL